jgi:hypothetical protein
MVSTVPEALIGPRFAENAVKVFATLLSVRFAPTILTFVLGAAVAVTTIALLIDMSKT